MQGTDNKLQLTVECDSVYIDICDWRTLIWSQAEHEGAFEVQKEKDLATLVVSVSQ